ncbi:MAG: hypothetical protein ACI9UT_001087 [Flavobacteriales bacterium]|jgi:hypothetical protein
MFWGTEFGKIVMVGMVDFILADIGLKLAIIKLLVHRVILS